MGGVRMGWKGGDWKKKRREGEETGRRIGGDKEREKKTIKC